MTTPITSADQLLGLWKLQRTEIADYDVELESLEFRADGSLEWYLKPSGTSLKDNTSRNQRCYQLTDSGFNHAAKPDSSPTVIKACFEDGDLVIIPPHGFKSWFVRCDKLYANSKPSNDTQAEVQRAITELKARVHAEDLKIAHYIEEHPSESIADAKAFVQQFLGSPRHTRYHWILRKWDRLLQTRTAAEIARIFRESREETEELRTSAPFCGGALASMESNGSDEAKTRFDLTQKRKGAKIPRGSLAFAPLRLCVRLQRVVESLKLFSIRNALSSKLAYRSRASVVECGGKPGRDTAVASRTAFFGLFTFFTRSTAVSPMRGFALASLPAHSTTLVRIVVVFSLMMCSLPLLGQKANDPFANPPPPAPAFDEKAYLESLEKEREEAQASHAKLFKEPLMKAIPSSTPTVRFVCIRTFHRPFCIRLFRESSGPKLRVVRFAGKGGYDWGKVDLDETKSIKESDWQAVLQAAKSPDVYAPLRKLKPIDADSHFFGLDGSTWFIETNLQSKPTFLSIWTPTAFVGKDAQEKPADVELQPLCDLGMLLIKLAGLPHNNPEDRIY